MKKEEINKIVEVAKESTRLSDISNYQVLNDHCIVAPVDFKEVSTTGLVNPSQYEDKNEYGVILATGPGRVLETAAINPTKCKVGDVVLYGQYSYTQLRVQGVDLNLIRHDDIIAILPTGSDPS